ncbi:hypothetical protein DACRYDRAFT_95062 [Dacryopinax primogenitus]|uniref:Sugar phosphate transporter domain-containing protein n=1 Tax=Dacryopinax primogenitus (strain DJM 731) TaxID=1858805 RepID=M5G6H8_DACPD|nr:uncharacterized protein DACRYDRAFT_95062 [Dacryopinax primogenitus]EJU01427.1 hypothetical protein DACRYDRAFT_95062 [Dacryopinax primogenitus]
MPQSNLQEQPASKMLVTATVTFYLVAAIAMVLANKWVLDKTTLPLFFLFVQLVIAVLLLLLAHLVGFLRLPAHLDIGVCRGLAPLVAINVLGLTFNNYTLKYVDASFYQVARGLVLPLTVGISFVVLHSRPSLRVLSACGIVTAGFFVGLLLDRTYSTSPASHATRYTFLGPLFGILSSCTTALHAVVIKRSLEVVHGSALELAWYSNLLSAFGLIPLVLVAGEGPGVIELLSGTAPVVGINTGVSALKTFVWGSLITGVIGFLICLAGFLSIKVTSPVTHMISSAVRGVLQSLLSVWFFGDIITTGRASGIGLILAGSIWYTWVRNVETQQAQEQAKPVYEQVPMKEVEEGERRD